MPSTQDKLLTMMLKEDEKQTNIGNKSLNIHIKSLSVMEEINRRLEELNGSNSSKKNDKVVSIVSGAFNGMGSGLKNMLDSLTILPKISDKKIYNFTNFLDQLMMTFERSRNIKSESLDSVLNIMNNMDIIIDKFIKFSLKSSIVNKLVPLADKGLTSIGNLFIKFESMLNESTFDFNKSSTILNNLNIVATGMKKFSYTMALNTPLSIIALPGFLATSAMIVGFSKVFSFIDLKDFENGAESMKALGFGIIGISSGLAIFQLFNISYETIGKTLLVTSGLSLILYSLSQLGGSVFKGVLGLLSLGGSLIVLSMGLKSLQELNLELSDIGVIMGALGGLALVTGIAGTFAVPIISGAAAFALIGLSLTKISAGLKSFSDLRWDDTITSNLKNAISGLSESFSTLGVIETASLSLKIALLGTASSTLKSLAIGLSEFKKSNFTEEDANKVQYVIGSISSAFAIAGSSDGTSSSVLSFLTGVDLSPNNVERGINSVQNVGTALTSITNGLIAWKGVYAAGFSPIDFQLDDSGMPLRGTVLYNIYSVLTAFKSVFAQIGQSANTGSSLIKNIFGADFSESDVEQGIESVSGAGEVIKNIAEGLITFKSLESMGFSSDDFLLDDNGLPMKGSLLHNIYSVLTVVKSIFAEIGKSANGNSSWIKSIFGTDFAESDVEQGIESVSGVADIVIGIANGLKVLSQIENVDEVSNTMTKLLTSYPKAAIDAYRTIQNSGIGFEELNNFLGDPYMKIVNIFDSIASTMLKLDGSDGSGFNKLSIGIDSIFSQVERITTVKGRQYTVMLFEKFVNSVEKLIKHKRDIKDLSNEFGNLGSSFSSVLTPIEDNFTSFSTPTFIEPTYTPTLTTPTPINNESNIETPQSIQSSTPKEMSNKEMYNMMQQMMLLLQNQMNIMNKNMESVAKSNSALLSTLNRGIKIQEDF